MHHQVLGGFFRLFFTIFGGFCAFDLDRIGQDKGEREGMTCSTGQYGENKPGAIAARTQPLYMWHPLYLLSYLGTSDHLFLSHHKKKCTEASQLVYPPSLFRIF